LEEQIVHSYPNDLNQSIRFIQSQKNCGVFIFMPLIQEMPYGTLLYSIHVRVP